MIQRKSALDAPLPSRSQFAAFANKGRRPPKQLSIGNREKQNPIAKHQEQKRVTRMQIKHGNNDDHEKHDHGADAFVPGLGGQRLDAARMHLSFSIVARH